VIVYAVVDDALSPDFPLGDAVDTFIRREDAERIIEEVRGDDPDLARSLRIEERNGDPRDLILAVLAHRLCNRIDYSIRVGRSCARDLERVRKAREEAIRRCRS
jgi:hypothetical protein